VQPDSLATSLADPAAGAAAAPADTPAVAATVADSLTAALDTLARAVDSLASTPADAPNAAAPSAFPDSLDDVKRAVVATSKASEGVWARLVASADGLLGFGSEITEDLLLTVVLAATLWAIRTAVLAAVRRSATDPRTVYRWRKGSLYLSVGLGALVLLPLWGGAVGSLATFFGLLTAGLAIALRDPVVNLVGWLYILWRRPFAPGDRVTVRTFTGDVTDQHLFGFTLLQVATETGAFQSTGRVVTVPNGWVFSDAVVNHTSAFPYVWHEIPVRVTFESDWRAAKEILLTIARERAEAFSADAEVALRRTASEHFIFFSALTPTVYTSVFEDGVRLTLRYLVLPRRLRTSEEAIWEGILDAFGAREEIAFAYRTQRVYHGPEETNPGLGGPPRGAHPERDGSAPNDTLP
jgi:small-conductance mechanosensitive channel